MFAHIAVEYGKLDDEVRYLTGGLMQAKQMTDDLQEAFGHILTRRPLNATQRQKVATAIDAVATDQMIMTNLRKIVVPIFNRPMTGEEAAVWRAKAEYLQSIARIRQILSEKSRLGFANLRLGKPLSEPEKNAVEFALQQMRTGGVQLAAELKRVGT